MNPADAPILLCMDLGTLRLRHLVVTFSGNECATITSDLMCNDANFSGEIRTRTAREIQWAELVEFAMQLSHKHRDKQLQVWHDTRCKYICS